ncbi:hypothetical protein [Noviherbaspirillum saxi]|uniref:Uncharacterized protein n=1 Tax=Noviherbaspirillum saxi TaxID=2320863 RepID=A0A3A3FHQ3_9BURK|nr:hypothetical protein [Noviherbaspirillum saxi]RJF92690.1 hypothetical protein D3871_29365 [Noviherbaspirillum saxi]
MLNSFVCHSKWPASKQAAIPASNLPFFGFTFQDTAASRNDWHAGTESGGHRQAQAAKLHESLHSDAARPVFPAAFQSAQTITQFFLKRGAARDRSARRLNHHPISLQRDF